MEGKKNDFLKDTIIEDEEKKQSEQVSQLGVNDEEPVEQASDVEML